MLMAVFWNVAPCSVIYITDVSDVLLLVVAPCSVIEIYRRFGVACCLCNQGDNGGRKHAC